MSYNANHNGRVVWRLALLSARRNRRRNLIMILTVALAVAAVMLSAVVTGGINQEEKNEAMKSAHAVLWGVPAGGISAMEADPAVARAELQPDSGAVGIWLVDAGRLTEQEAEDAVRSAAGRGGIPEGSISFETEYFRCFNSRYLQNQLASTALVVVSVMSAAAIVVYSIFYISVGDRVRDYGQLRTLGATRRQVRRMVVFEGLFLALPGVLAGQLLGCTLGYAVKPGGWAWGNNLPVIVIVGLLCIAFVCVSVYAPAKRAGDVSPARAVRYSAATGAAGGGRHFSAAARSGRSMQ